MNNLNIIDASAEEIELVNNSKPEKKIENIFNSYGYLGKPSDNISDLVEYKKQLEEETKRRREWRAKYDKKQKEENGESSKDTDTTTDAASEPIDGELVKEEVLTENKIKYVICFIDDYNDVEAFIKVTRPDESKPLTNLELLALYTKAYQYMYAEEEKDNGGDPGHIEGLLNRERSSGRYEIWGHDIGDLIFNGYSEISIYENFIFCNFSVDS